jgi:hypothetical protein
MNETAANASVIFDGLHLFALEYLLTRPKRPDERDERFDLGQLTCAASQP